MTRQKITAFLWFDSQAEEAANFYVSRFKDSRITHVTPGPTGAALVVEFELAGIKYIALNGGPMYKFSEAISMSVDCTNQAEVDKLWEKLSEGGSKSQCGWLKDKYGLSWQIVPAILAKLMTDPSGRTLGGLWTIGEGEGEMPGGGVFQSIMTLGYDPQMKQFVGTFIAGVMTRLWPYNGSLDADEKVLTLDSEGPSFAVEGTMAKYQDIIEFLSDDYRTLSSPYLGPDGTWVPFMKAHYHRVK